MRITQIRRIQHMAQWLRDGKRFTRRTAVKAFGCSVRTISEDIERMRSLGVPVEFDASKNTFYTTDDFGDLPALSIKKTEYAAFLVAQYALDTLGGTPDAALLRAVVERLASQLPEQVKVEEASLSQHIQIDRSSKPRRPAPYLVQWRDAIEYQQVVQIRYRGNQRGKETERDVAPYRLLHRDGYWYLIAHCRLRDGLRSFRADRIYSFKNTGEVFLHDPDLPIDAYLDETFGIYQDERAYAIHVRFSAYQARWVEEEIWHPTAILTKRPDGTLDVRMTVTGLKDVTRWVLSYGAEATVLSPPELRRHVAREAQQMVKRYIDP